MSEKIELPKGWKWVKISEISNVVRGGSPRPAGDPKFYDGDIPFLKVRDLTKNNDVHLKTFEYTIKEAGLHKTRQITPNTLLLSNSGATLGIPKICMINATMNDGIAAFLDLDVRSNLYLYYFWLSKTRELRNINMGAAQPNLNTDIIKNYLIPYCSFEQQAIVVTKIEELLSDLENGKQQLLTAQAQLKVYRQSLLKWAFEGKLTNKNVKDGELPEGWKWKKLGDVASKITDGEHITPRRTSDGILLLSARNIQNGHLALNNVDYIPIDEYERIIKRCNPEYGDILISCSGSIGRVCRVPLNLKFTLVRSVALVKFDWLKSSSKFYEYLFQSPLLQSQIEKSKKATAQANLFLGPIKNLNVIVCSLAEQTRIVEELESKLTICDKLEETISQSLAQSETLRQSILKKAFEGKLV